MSDDAKSVAEKQMPGWKAVEEHSILSSAVDARPLAVDSIGPDLDRLKSKYFGETPAWPGSDGGAAVAPAQPIDGDNSTLVVMERTNSIDSSPSRKTVLVYGKTVIGTQG